MFGSSAANELAGGGGGDALYEVGRGPALRPVLRRTLFIFLGLKDSGPTVATRDTIFDFEGAGVAGGDTISLFAIDEKLGNIINFLGTNANFAGNAGDLARRVGRRQDHRAT